MNDTINKYISCLNKCPAFCDCIQLPHPNAIINCLNSDFCCQNCQTTQSYNYPRNIYPQIFAKKIWILFNRKYRQKLLFVQSFLQTYEYWDSFKCICSVTTKSKNSEKLKRQVTFCDDNKVNNFIDGVQTSNFGVPKCQRNDAVCQAGFLSGIQLSKYNTYFI